MSLALRLVRMSEPGKTKDEPRGGDLVLRLGVEVARLVPLAQLAGSPLMRFTIRPRWTAGRLAIASVQRWTFL
jgi:hypothetical protein